MTTNKPGSVSQPPLYGCVRCIDYHTYPADYLRVHKGECWCDDCWDAEQGIDDPLWSDLEPFVPALQAENEQLRKDAERYRWLRNQHWSNSEAAVLANPRAGAKLGSWLPSKDLLDNFIDAAMTGGET